MPGSVWEKRGPLLVHPPSFAARSQEDSAVEEVVGVVSPVGGRREGRSARDLPPSAAIDVSTDLMRTIELSTGIRS